MPEFSERSKKNLETCHPKLQQIFGMVIKHVDCTIICGYRGKEAQGEAYRTGNSNKEFPNSKHNANPSWAVDVAPYPINWNNKERFYMFAGFVRGVASSLGIKIRCGADWDGDFETSDQSFFDLPHFELVR